MMDAELVKKLRKIAEDLKSIGFPGMADVVMEGADRVDGLASQRETPIPPPSPAPMPKGFNLDDYQAIMDAIRLKERWEKQQRVAELKYKPLRIKESYEWGKF